MKKKYTGIELMAAAPVGVAIFRLALPMIAAMLAQSIYSMTDMFFIGQTNDPNMVAAVSLAFPLFMLAQAIGNIFAVGGSSYISRMLGAGKRELAVSTASVSFYITIAAGVVLTAFLFFFKTPILNLIGASQDTFAHTDSYYTVLVFFICAAAANAVMSGQMRSEGETKKAMTLQLIGIVTNIVLDPILILGFNFGTAGAAWATVIGICASAVYGIRYFTSKKSILSISPSEFKPTGEMLSQILAIGIPSGIANIIMSVSHIICNRICASYGDHVVAGVGIQNRVSSLIFMFIFAVVQGYQPFAGYNYGAKQYERLLKGFKVTIVSTTVYCILGSFALYFLGEGLIGVFINDAATIEAGAAMLKCFIWGLPFIGAQITLMVSFQAFGKPLQAMIITLGRQLFLYLPMLYIFNKYFGFEGFIWAQPGADILMTGVAVILGLSIIRLFSGKRKTNPVDKV